MLQKINLSFLRHFLSIILALVLFIPRSSIPVYAATPAGDIELNNGRYSGLSDYIRRYELSPVLDYVYYDLSVSGERVVRTDNNLNAGFYTTTSNLSDVCNFSGAVIKFPDAVFSSGEGFETSWVYQLEFKCTFLVNSSLPIDWLDHAHFYDLSGNSLNSNIDQLSSYVGRNGVFMEYDVEINSLSGYLNLADGLIIYYGDPYDGDLAGSTEYFTFTPRFITDVYAISDADGSTYSDQEIGNINNKLDSVTGELSDIKNIVIAGNEASQSAGTAIDNANDSFNDAASQYEQIEQNYTQSMVDDLNDIKDEVEGFNLTGNLLVASRWLGTEMMFIFNRLGDFKMFILVPCILGLALFFIGRGIILFK